jgi:hypothetical protein
MRGIVGEERRGKKMDGCPPTLSLKSQRLLDLGPRI